MSEIPNDEDNDHLFQDEIDVSNFVEKTFFRKSALSNEYIKNLRQNSKLHIKQAKRAINLFKKKGHAGLIHLFLPIETLDSYRQYTNERLAQLGPNKKASRQEFMAYIGLEIATSLVPLNQHR